MPAWLGDWRIIMGTSADALLSDARFKAIVGSRLAIRYSLHYHELYSRQSAVITVIGARTTHTEDGVTVLEASTHTERVHVVRFSTYDGMRSKLAEWADESHPGHPFRRRILEPKEFVGTAVFGVGTLFDLEPAHPSLQFYHGMFLERFRRHRDAMRPIVEAYPALRSDADVMATILKRFEAFAENANEAHILARQGSKLS